jgi:hypothetical protein
VILPSATQPRHWAAGTSFYVKGTLRLTTAAEAVDGTKFAHQHVPRGRLRGGSAITFSGVGWQRAD